MRRNSCLNWGIDLPTATPLARVSLTNIVSRAVVRFTGIPCLRIDWHVFWNRKSFTHTYPCSHTSESWSTSDCGFDTHITSLTYQLKYVDLPLGEALDTHRTSLAHHTRNTLVGHEPVGQSSSSPTFIPMSRAICRTCLRTFSNPPRSRFLIVMWSRSRCSTGLVSSSILSKLYSSRRGSVQKTCHA